MTRRGQYGHVVNISSMSGHRVPNGSSGGSFYAATKHALRALTEGLRQEVRGGAPAPAPLHWTLAAWSAMMPLLHNRQPSVLIVVDKPHTRTRSEAHAARVTC